MAEKLGLNDIIGGISGLGAMAGSAYSTYSNVQGPDSWASKLRANELSPSIGNLNSFDDWTNAYLSYRPMTSSMLDDETFGFNKGQGILNIGNSVLSGAGTGAKLGGVYGAIGGGLLGLGAGLFGFNAAKNKAENTRQYAKNMLADINRRNNSALLNGLYNIKQGQYDRLNYATYAEGGQLHTHGADWNTGLNYVGNGGSHEENPYDGVPMGIAPDGQPNLVEEGEVVWNNDYVFSKRLKVPKAIRRKYRLGGLKPLSFADAVMKVNKDVEERPNDPIALRGRDAILGALAEVQDMKRAKKEAKEQQDMMLQQEMMNQPGMPMMAARGGYLRHRFDLGGRTLEYVNALRDALGLEPIGDIGDDSDYKEEVKEKKPKKEKQRKEKTPKIKGKPFQYDYSDEDDSFSANWLALHPEDRIWIPSDGPYQYPGSRNYKIDTPITYIEGYDPITGTPIIKTAPRTTTLPSEGLLPKKQVNPDTPEDEVVVGGKDNNFYDPVSKLRYAPAVGAGLAVLSDLFGWTNKPDYKKGAAIRDAARGIRDVGFDPVGGYMREQPVDLDYILNALNAASGANRRALMDIAGGNRGTAMAGILASDNQYLNSIGAARLAAEKENFDRSFKVHEFNSKLDEFNKTGLLNAAVRNQAKDEVVAKYLALAADADSQDDVLASKNRSINLTNFWDNLGAIGEDAANRMDTRWLAQNWPGANAPSSHGKGNIVGYQGKCGGRLNKRRRRR